MTETPYKCTVCNSPYVVQVDTWFNKYSCDKHIDVPPAYIDVAKLQLEELGYTEWDNNES